MAVFTAKNGNAQWDSSDIPDVRTWTVNDGGSVQTYVSSDTGGGTGRVDGADDWTASVTCFQQSDAPVTSQVKKGDTGTLDLFENGTLQWSAPVICLGVTVNENIEGTEIVGYNIEFGWDAAAGAITRPTAA